MTIIKYLFLVVIQSVDRRSARHGQSGFRWMRWGALGAEYHDQYISLKDWPSIKKPLNIYCIFF